MTKNPILNKILFIGVLTLALLIPLKMIESKIMEREQLQNNVQRDIAQSSAGPQTLRGPYLVVSYKLRKRSIARDDKAQEQASSADTGPFIQVISPHELKIEGNADVETRKRGIYKARLYNLHSNISGSFVVSRNLGLDYPADDVLVQNVHLAISLSDLRGIRNNPVLTLNGSKLEFKPGNIAPLSGNGIHADINTLDISQEHLIEFSFPVELQGMSKLSVMPSGNNTEMKLVSSWPHPSFGGRYLPRSHTENAQGFQATWQIPRLARNSSAESETAQLNNAENFSVDFVDPVNIYLLSQRAVKYGVMFVVLVFTAFFLFEMLRALPIHPIQYLFVGLALAVFFLLTISLSEHISFGWAYIASSTACSILIGLYLGGVLKSWKPATLFSASIATLYGVIYGVLQSEDNALLMGSLIMFIALASVMLLTRRMDWYRLNEQ